MQRSGVRHDDPEYIKAHNILAAVQKQQAFQKQRQLHQQQLQQQQLQQQQQQVQQQQQTNGNNADVVANGVNGMSCIVLAK
jgi:ATP-dependent helicase STH1/SNF2